MQPFQVSGHADQILFFTDRLYSTEQELAKPYNSLDNAEERINGAFSFGVEGPATSGLQPMRHQGTLSKIKEYAVKDRRNQCNGYTYDLFG